MNINFFNNIIAYKSDIISKYTLIKGDVQSGKSLVIKNLISKHLKQDISCVLVLMDMNAQREQMIDSIKNYSKSIKILSGIKTKVLNNKNKYINTITCKSPRLIILIANTSQVSTFNKLINETLENNLQHKYILLIDEIDVLNKFCDNKNNKSKIKLQSEIKLTIQNSFLTYGLTATSFDVFFNEIDCKISRIFTIPHKNNYYGIDKIKFIDLPSTDDKLYSPKLNGISQLEQDPNLLSIYLELSKEKPYYISDLDIYHPINVLHKTSHFTKHHEELFKIFIEHSILKNIWSVIIYNGKGIKLYSKNIKDKINLKIDKKKSDIQNYIYFFNSQNIRQIYSLLLENHITHIVTIAGNLADRGINFVDLNYHIKLTHEYYLPSQNTSMINMIQSMRLCGIYNYNTDNLPLICYCPDTVSKEIKRTFWLQEDMLKRIENNKQNNQENKEEEEEKCIVDFFYDETFNQSKIPIKHKLCLSTTKKTIKEKVRIISDSEKDNGIDLDHFIEKVVEEKVDNESITKNTNKEDNEENNENINEGDNKENNECTYDINEYNRLKEMFKIWKNKNTIISNFLKNLDPNKIYTEQEIRNYCKKQKISLSHLQHRKYKLDSNDNKLVSKGYGLIIETINKNQENKLYRLYPKLKNIYNLYFKN